MLQVQCLSSAFLLPRACRISSGFLITVLNVFSTTKIELNETRITGYLFAVTFANWVITTGIIRGKFVV